MTDFKAAVSPPLSEALSRLSALTSLQLELGESPDVLMNEAPVPPSAPFPPSFVLCASRVGLHLF